MYLLKNWSVGNRGPYDPPEMGSYLRGNIYNHPNFKEGSYIRTSKIKDTKGRLIFTKSGSEYLLDGDPAPEYVKFLEKIGYEFNPENPIKMLPY